MSTTLSLSFHSPRIYETLTVSLFILGTGKIQFFKNNVKETPVSYKIGKFVIQ